jgi:hypothetical protein
MYWGFLSFSWVLQQTLSWCTHHTLHHVLHVRPNMLISKFGPNRARTPILSLLLHTQNSPISITLTPSLPNSLPCLESTFTRRMSGHCLGTHRATKCPVNFPATLQLSNRNICVQTGQCVTCCLLQHCWDQASEAVVWINLEDRQGNTQDLAFSMISVLVRSWTVTSPTRHKTYWQ